MDSDFFGVLWTLFLIFLGIGLPILEKRAKKRKAQGRMTPPRSFTRPSAGTAIDIPDKKDAFSPIKVDEEEIKWPERDLTPQTKDPGEDITRSILEKIFGEDLFSEIGPEVQSEEDLPSSSSPDDEGVCSLGTHESRVEARPQPAAAQQSAPVPKDSTRTKIIDDPKKMIVYAEIMKPKYDEF